MDHLHSVIEIQCSECFHLELGQFDEPLQTLESCLLTVLQRVRRQQLNKGLKEKEK